MIHTSSRCGVAMVAMVGMLTVSAAAYAQDAPKVPEAGCTTSNGVSTGAGCETGTGGSAEGKVENGMPATEHQQEVLRTDDKATQGQNMEATGSGGKMPETEHQADVLAKPDPAKKN